MSNDFPKTYKCPKCGNSETVIHKALAPLKASGQVVLDFYGAMEAKMTPLQDPQKCQVSVTCVITTWDICFNCGEYYCTKAEIKNVPATMFNNPMNMRFS